ncbi:MAG: LysM peptidoglycan-binding domain-containing protein [Armatimonadota bacterium]
MPGNFVSPEEGQIRALRRRLWLERVFWVGVIGVIAAVHLGALPGGRRTVLVLVNGEPTAVVASRADAHRLLEEIKGSSQAPASEVTFLEKITLHGAPAERNPAQSDSEALKALLARVHPVVRAAAIVTNGEVVLGLPDQKEALKTLSAMLRKFSPPGGEAQVYFKGQVKVETREVPPDRLYPNAEAAIAKIEQDAQPKGEYEVRPGDSAWKIALEHDVPLSRLAAANPEVNMDRVIAGQRLKIPGELPPITVIARKEIEEPVSSEFGAPMRRVRITYENGAVVSREVIRRAPRRATASSRSPGRGDAGEAIR